MESNRVNPEHAETRKGTQLNVKLLYYRSRWQILSAKIELYQLFFMFSRKFLKLLNVVNPSDDIVLFVFTAPRVFDRR